MNSNRMGPKNPKENFMPVSMDLMALMTANTAFLELIL